MKQPLPTLATLLLTACAPRPPFPPPRPRPPPPPLRHQHRPLAPRRALPRGQLARWLGLHHRIPPPRWVPGGGSLEPNPLRGQLRAPPPLPGALRLLAAAALAARSSMSAGTGRGVHPFSTGATRREGDGRRVAAGRGPPAGGHRARGRGQRRRVPRRAGGESWARRPSAAGARRSRKSPGGHRGGRGAARGGDTPPGHRADDVRLWPARRGVAL